MEALAASSVLAMPLLFRWASVRQANPLNNLSNLNNLKELNKRTSCRTICYSNARKLRINAYIL